MVIKPGFTIFSAAFISFTGVLQRGSALAAIADPKEGWHELWQDLLIDITFIGVVFAAITLYFLVKYRRRHPDEEGSGSKLSVFAIFGWVLIPAFVFMADDIFLAAKNFTLWNEYRRVPAGAYVVEVEAYMWGWDFKYAEGVTATNELRVAVGRPVKVRLNSRDVVHSFFIPDYKVKWDTMPGRETYLWFYPDKVGEHVITCAEYCGMLHSGMHGKLIVMPEDEFLKWLKDNKNKGGMMPLTGGSV